MNDDDFQIVRRVLAGERNAFRDLVLRYQAPIFRFIKKVLGQPGEHEDVAQEVFLAAYAALSGFDPAQASYWARRSTKTWRPVRDQVLRCWSHIPMTIRTLPLDASDDNIKFLVVEWSELLAQKRFQDAFDMFLHVDRESPWTPALLEKVIAGYGVPDIDPGTQAMMLEDWGVERFEISTLLGRPDKDEIIAEKIDVDREHRFGLDPKNYLGMVHYNDVPISGYRSDLTARFRIKRVGTDRMTLEFRDLHVM